MHRSLHEKTAVALPLVRFWESLVFREKKTTESEVIEAAKPKRADLMHDYSSFGVFNYHTGSKRRLSFFTTSAKSYLHTQD